MEIAELRKQQGNDSSASNDGVEKLKKDYLQKLNLLEDQVAELKKRLGSQSQFSTQRKRADESTKQLQLEIQSLFKSCLPCDIHFPCLLFFADSHVGARNRNGQIIQDAERELEVTTELHKLGHQYESKIGKMAEEITLLKEETEMHRQKNIRSPSHEEDLDSPEKDLDIQDLKEQVNNLSSLLKELHLQKEKVNYNEKKQVLIPPLLSDDSNDKIKMDTPETKISSESNVKRGKTAEGLCCSCGKRSLCKTTKCRCRSAGGSCGPSCGCTHAKCTNREPDQLAGTESLNSENSKCTSTASAVDTDGCMIASECAELLQSALAQKPSRRENPGTKKKPLCDIQNSLVNLDAQKQGKKKKGRKPVIHIVTKDPMSSSPGNNSNTETYRIGTQESNAMRLD